jgi:hypothetical protein
MADVKLLKALVALEGEPLLLALPSSMKGKYGLFRDGSKRQTKDTQCQSA